MVWPKNSPGSIIRKIPQSLETHKVVHTFRRIRYEDPKAKILAVKWIRPAPTKRLPDYPKGKPESQNLALHPPRRPLQDEDIYGIIKSIQSGLASGQSDDAVPDQARKSIDSTPMGTKNDRNDTDPADLPLSPLMHSRLIQARRRFKEPKPLPTEEYNEFQRLINQNAYAHILASPIRVCAMTSVRLPSAMMIPFTLKRDQRTGRLWQVPDGFEKEAADPNQETTLSDLGSDLVRSPSRELALDLHLSNGDRSSVDAKYPPAVPRVSKAYISAQYPAIAHIAYMARHARSRYPRVIPYRWKEIFGEKLKDVVFREDMADFILSLLRKRVVKVLVDNFEDRTAEGSVGVWRAVEGLPERLIAVLWFPPLVQGNERGEKSDIEVIESKPPTYTAFRHEGQLAPLFNLQELLGDKEVVRLRNSWAEAAATENPTWRFKDAVMRIRKRELSGQLVAALWLLRRYLGMEEVVGVRKGKYSLTPTENLSPKRILDSNP